MFDKCIYNICYGAWWEQELTDGPAALWVCSPHCKDNIGTLEDSWVSFCGEIEQ